MNDKITLNQAREDLKYLKGNYGSAVDFCGTFCTTNKFESILFGHCTVKETIISYIKYYFNNGIDTGECNKPYSNIKPNIKDKRVQRIIKRYNIQL